MIPASVLTSRKWMNLLLPPDLLYNVSGTRVAEKLFLELERNWLERKYVNRSAYRFILSKGKRSFSQTNVELDRFVVVIDALVNAKAPRIS